MTPWWRSKRRLRRVASLSSCLLLPLLGGLSPAPARGQGVFDAIGTEVDRVFQQSKGAVVRVHAQQGRFQTVGSGFFVDNQGTLVTAAAILGPSRDIAVDFNGLDLPAHIVGIDTRSGLAVLHVFGGTTPFLAFSHGAQLRTATPVVGVGYPLNLPAAPAFGMVTGFDSQYLDHFFATTHLRTSLSISPGQIGGPVLDGHGQVVGMIVMAADERKFTYALPSPAIEKLLADFGAHGRVEHGWVGVGVNPQSESKEVRITQIFPGAPAALSGLQPGDIVVRIDKREIVHPSDVIDASFFARVGQELPVVVSREGKLMTFKFIVSERPTQIPVVLSPGASPAAGGPVQGLRVSGQTP